MPSTLVVLSVKRSGQDRYNRGLFVAAQTTNNLNAHPKGMIEYIVIYIHIMDYYIAVKGNELIL